VDEDEVFERYRALLRSTSAFGDALALSGRTRRRFSDASHLAAENLLEKAYRAWREHPPRAAAYVDKAARLPYDDHERVFPVAAAAIMRLFDLLVDELEDADEDEDLWLDVALTVLRGTTSSARFDMRDMLLALDQDWNDVERRHRKIRAASELIPPQTALRELQDLTPDHLRDRVMAILELCVTYEEELEEAWLAVEG